MNSSKKAEKKTSGLEKPEVVGKSGLFMEI